MAQIRGSQISGSVASASLAAFALTASYAIGFDTGSLTTTSSFNSFTSSYYIDSSSFTTRIDNLENFSSSLDATFATDAELNAATASLSASISSLSSSFDAFSGSYNTGSFTGSFIGSLVGTSSYSDTATSASYAVTASYVELAQTSSYYDETDPVFTAVSGTFVLTSSFNSFTSSYNTGSFTGSFIGDGSQLTGIVSSKWSGSNPISRQSDVEITGSLRVQGSITGSLYGTASWAENAITASYVTLAQTASYVETSQTASYVLNAISSSFATSASFALTASYLDNYVPPFPFTGSALITGSFGVTGSIASTTLAGLDTRVVLADTQGSLTSSNQTLIEAYINPTSSAALLINNTANWNIYGIYTGSAITGTVQGQRYYNIDYFFEATDDNDWIRLIRG